MSSAVAPIGPVELDERGLVSWGETIGRTVERPIVVALSGELGAGKSVLARAIARGASVRAKMPSPTFNLLYRYETPTGRVTHVDLYRLDDPDEVWELGWRELAAPDEIVLIEWPANAGSYVPVPRWDVTLDVPSAGASTRIVRAVPVGDVQPLPIPTPEHAAR